MVATNESVKEPVSEREMEQAIGNNRDKPDTSCRPDGSPPSVCEYEKYLNGLDPSQREKIFGKRDYFFKGIDPSLRARIRMDEEASYSVTEMRLAEETSRLIRDALEDRLDPRSATITDATACIGGNTINFAKHFAHVNAVEIDPKRFNMLEHNVRLLCDTSRVQLHHGDFTSAELKQDIVFFDPPWGGVEYSKQKKVPLFLSKKPLAEVCRGLLDRAKFIVLKLPYNFAMSEFRDAARRDGAMEEVPRFGWREMGRLPGRPPKFIVSVWRLLESRAGIKRREREGYAVLEPSITKRLISAEE